MLRTAYLTSDSNLGAHISLIEMERISDMPLNGLSIGLSMTPTQTHKEKSHNVYPISSHQHNNFPSAEADESPKLRSAVLLSTNFPRSSEQVDR